LPYAVDGLVCALNVRGKGHGPAVEAALIITWRTRCELAAILDKSEN
jgi:hypothetical protein